ncbi:MAG: exosortase C-terminal domain/associated protein EpsI [Gemmataceae bacterium]
MPARCLTPWLVLAAGGAAVLVAVGCHWSDSAEFFDRALVVLVTVWLLVRSRRLWMSAGNGHISGLIALLPTLVLFPLAWYLVAQVGPRPVLLWWLAATGLLAASGVALACGGTRSLRTLAFPLLFLLFALPVPRRVELPVQAALQEVTTSLAAAALPQLGIAAQRDGFVLHLPAGDLGVIEACSGIRSVPALLALAALVGYARGIQLLRGLLLVGLALPFIVLANALRVTLSGVLLERLGRAAVEATAHELLGYGTVLAVLGLILAASQLLRRRRAGPAVNAADVPSMGPPLAGRAHVAAALLGLTLLLSGVAAGLGWRVVERQQTAAPLEQLPQRIDDWQGEDVPIPTDIAAMLTCDRAVQRIYRNPLGQEVHVWVIFWAGAGSVRGYHHPDVCWPNRGWSVTGDTHSLPIGRGSHTIPVTLRRYARGQRRQLVLYWTQEGRRIWTDVDEEAALLEGTPRHRWLRERLSGAPLVQSGRLAVLIGGDLWGNSEYAEHSVRNFAESFASNFYCVLPWADPAAPPLNPRGR